MEKDPKKGIAAEQESKTVELSSVHDIVKPEPVYAICDKQFMDDVYQLKALRSYLIRQAKHTEVAAIGLGSLNLLRFDSDGRQPEAEEWGELESKSSQLYQHLTESDRRRFLYSQIPPITIKTAAALGVIALGALLVTVTAGVFWEYMGFKVYTVVIFATFLAWVAALGGIGSIAFIGMNALAVQQDATFDITNKKLVGLRVLLGALFSVVLTLPFGYEAFIDFIGGLAQWEPKPSTPGTASGSLGTASGSPGINLSGILLLLPFILGFSATLVIMILNQLVEAVQTFFGKGSTPPLEPAKHDERNKQRVQS